MTILDVVNLSKHYPISAGLLQREVARVRAADDVNFSIRRGETLALVGESGCGKTTVARCILRALRPTSGAINFSPEDGQVIDLAQLGRHALRPLRRHMQLIFQDPYASLNPRMMVGDIIGEPLLVHGVPSQQRHARVRELLDLVGLPASARTRFPHAFSGGQRQRIGIARALALHPRLVVADEPVSALDVSVQAQIINLLLDLQDRLGLSMLFVAHDLGVVRHVSDRVAVMYVGRIVEVATTEALYATPLHPYTQALLSAVPKADPAQRDAAAAPMGEVADPINPPPGCAFHPRCPFAEARCRTERPALIEVAPGHLSACHRASELTLAGVT
jgi:oligopeptide/dipeptide ABC transporter ATP-binding protein